LKGSSLINDLTPENRDNKKQTSSKAQIVQKQNSSGTKQFRSKNSSQGQQFMSETHFRSKLVQKLK